MAWVILGLGAALSLSGVAALWSGVSYMPVEWGWSQIIAGTTALTGGIVTIGLAAVVQRLGALQALWRSGPRPSASVGDGPVQPEMLDAAAPVVPLARRRDDSTEPSAAEPPSRASTQAEANEPIGPPIRPDIAAADRVSPNGSQARRVGIGDIGGLTPLAAAEPYGTEPPAGVPDPAPEPPAESADALPVLADPESPDLTVVGRYQAGGATYALYSDGTIEVETESGTHHFASMAELKAFLERQDHADQPGWPE